MTYRAMGSTRARFCRPSPGLKAKRRNATKVLARWIEARRSAVIFRCRDGFKVGGIYAVPDPAKVVQNQPVRDWANILLINDAVGWCRAAIDRDGAVALVVYGAGPKPTVAAVSVYPRFNPLVEIQRHDATFQPRQTQKTPHAKLIAETAKPKPWELGS